MKIAFYTLGCKVNQFETQAVELMLSENGHDIVDDFSVADVIVVNTCTVTSTSDQKSRRMIRYFAKTYPNARIAVCGCLSQISPKSIENIDGVHIISGTSGKRDFAKAIEDISAVKQESLTIDNALKKRDFESLPSGGLHGHTRAMLKIEDGCTNFCTYCIIPYTRGPVRSMPLDDAIKECRKLSDAGYKEVVLTGIEISSYGRDLSPKLALAEIIAALCEHFPEMRFRLGSIEPRTITEEFCVKLKAFTNLCPHFHLSLQSGCDKTLERMKRKYDSARFHESVSLLNSFFPGCAITTDLIVGFPGEDEDEFSQTLAFIEKCEFSSMHIFPYSRRNGTPAASMENQITKAEKSARAKRASAVAQTLEKKYLEKLVGTTHTVLFEEISDDMWRGHAPNYVTVYVKSEKYLNNCTRGVRIISPFRDGVLGEFNPE